MIHFLAKYLEENGLTMGKFAIVGFTAAVIDFGLLYVLTEFVGLHYLISATISFIVAATWNYFLNRRWTFQSEGSKTRQIPVFFVIAVCGIIFNNSILFLGVEKLGLWYIYSKLIAAAFVTAWNFIGNKYITFRIK